MVMLQGGDHRFKTVSTPKDYIAYQSFLDFCYNCSRPNMKVPFDKREIEVELLDFHNFRSINSEDIQRLEEGIN